MRKEGTTMATLTDIKAANPGWFSSANKRFFNDISYKARHGKATRAPYLVRSTYGWSDMFGGPKRLHYRINLIEDDLTIGELIDDEFASLNDVSAWLKLN